MEEEKRSEKLNVKASEESAGQETVEISAADAPDLPEVQRVCPKSPSVENQGRMIKAGLIAAIILSGIAVLVAGIFQLTSRWLITCPTDLPVNDPAPILWSDLISDRVTPTSLVVPKGVAMEVWLKAIGPATSDE